MIPRKDGTKESFGSTTTSKSHGLVYFWQDSGTLTPLYLLINPALFRWPRN